MREVKGDNKKWVLYSFFGTKIRKLSSTLEGGERWQQKVNYIFLQPKFKNSCLEGCERWQQKVRNFFCNQNLKNSTLEGGENKKWGLYFLATKIKKFKYPWRRCRVTIKTEDYIFWNQNKINSMREVKRDKTNVDYTFLEHFASVTFHLR